jgi:hypothetical protein
VKGMEGRNVVSNGSCANDPVTVPGEWDPSSRLKLPPGDTTSVILSFFVPDASPVPDASLLVSMVDRGLVSK